jgi:hypothetical protein
MSQIERLRQIQNAASHSVIEDALISRIAFVAMATIITKASSAHTSGVKAPRTSNNPQTNSTVETKRALKSGKGMCASTNFWRICSRRSGAKSLLRPERKTANPQRHALGECRAILTMPFVNEDSDARHRSKLKSNTNGQWNRGTKATQGTKSTIGRESFLQPLCFAATNIVREKTSCQNDHS